MVARYQEILASRPSLKEAEAILTSTLFLEGTDPNFESAVRRSREKLEAYISANALKLELEEFPESKRTIDKIFEIASGAPSVENFALLCMQVDKLEELCGEKHQEKLIDLYKNIKSALATWPAETCMAPDHWFPTLKTEKPTMKWMLVKYFLLDKSFIYLESGKRYEINLYPYDIKDLFGIKEVRESAEIISLRDQTKAGDYLAIQIAQTPEDFKKLRYLDLANSGIIGGRISSFLKKAEWKDEKGNKRSHLENLETLLIGFNPVNAKKDPSNIGAALSVLKKLKTLDICNWPVFKKIKSVFKEMDLRLPELEHLLAAQAPIEDEITAYNKIENFMPKLSEISLGIEQMEATEFFARSKPVTEDKKKFKVTYI